MIKINIEVSYPGLKLNEQARIMVAIRRVLQPSIAQAACMMMKDPVPPDLEGEFIRSINLDIRATYEITS